MSDRYLYNGREVILNFSLFRKPEITFIDTNKTIEIDPLDIMLLYKLPPKYVNTPLYKKLEGLDE